MTCRTEMMPDKNRRICRHVLRMSGKEGDIRKLLMIKMKNEL